MQGKYKARYREEKLEQDKGYARQDKWKQRHVKGKVGQ